MVAKLRQDENAWDEAPLRLSYAQALWSCVWTKTRGPHNKYKFRAEQVQIDTDHAKLWQDEYMEREFVQDENVRGRISTHPCNLGRKRFSVGYPGIYSHPHLHYRRADISLGVNSVFIVGL